MTSHVFSLVAFFTAPNCCCYLFHRRRITTTRRDELEKKSCCKIWGNPSHSKSVHLITNEVKLLYSFFFFFFILINSLGEVFIIFPLLAWHQLNISLDQHNYKCDMIINAHVRITSWTDRSKFSYAPPQLKSKEKFELGNIVYVIYSSPGWRQTWQSSGAYPLRIPQLAMMVSMGSHVQK